MGRAKSSNSLSHLLNFLNKDRLPERVYETKRTVSQAADVMLHQSKNKEKKRKKHKPRISLKRIKKFQNMQHKLNSDRYKINKLNMPFYINGKPSHPYKMNSFKQNISLTTEEEKRKTDGLT